MQRLLDGVLIHLFTTDHFHGLPVVGEFSAAIQTDYVGPGDTGGLSTADLTGYGEAVILVPTAEEHIYQTRHHYHTPGGPNCEMVLPGVSDSSYLDSGTLPGVSNLREIHTALRMVHGRVIISFESCTWP